MIALWAGLAVAAALAVVLYRLWAKRVRTEIAEGARVVFQRYQEQEPQFIEGLSLEEFAAAYERARFPRFPRYLLIAAALFVLVLPAVFGLLSGAVWLGEQTGLIAQPAELAKYVPIGEAKTTIGQAEREEVALYLARDFAGFYYFFGVIFAWMAIVALVMRRYHQTRPGDVREEVIRAKDAKGL